MIRLLQHAEKGGNNTNDTSQSSWLVVDSGTLASGSRGCSATSGGTSDLGAGATWVRLLTGTGESSLDDVVWAREGLEVGAGVSNVGRGLEVEGTTNVSKNWKRDVGEVSVKVKGTTDGLEHWEADGFELGVVGDLETTLDRPEHWHVELGQVGVGNEGESTSDGGEVWCADGGNLVAVESEGTVQSSKRWRGKGGNVADGHVVCPNQVWECGTDVPAVGLEGEGVGDVAKLHVNLVKIVVVGNEHGSDLLQVDTVQAVELSVLDRDGHGGLNTLGTEGKRLQSVEDVPVDGLNVCELWEVEVGEDGQALQAECVGDSLESRTREGGHAGDVVGDQATLNRLETIKSDVVGGASGNGNATSEGRAAGDR